MPKKVINMLKILIILLLLSPLSVQAGSMTGTIEVSLTILPSPCTATSSEKLVTVDCGNIKQLVKTTIEKQSSTEKLSDNYVVTITY
jgi:type 1 fimbria pilin